jgi:hypothetical protein
MKNKIRGLYGSILSIIGLIALVNMRDLFAVFTFELFIWILSWAFLGLGIYAFLLGIFWWKQGLIEEKLSETTRKYFRYISFQLVMSTIISVWIFSLNIPKDNQYLLGSGLGLFLGIWIHTIYQGIDKLRDNIKIP